jgi:hypothetical protein
MDRNRKRRDVPSLRVLLAALAVVVVSGCSSYLTVGRLPVSQDFQRSVPELKSRYPAFTEFAPSLRRYLVAWIQERPPAEEIFTAWGEPDGKGVPWLWWEFPAIVSRPYYWQKEDKLVTAVISRPIFVGFRPRIYSLDVEPVDVEFKR